ERRRKRDVYDRTRHAKRFERERFLPARLAHGVHRGRGHVVEAARPSRADVENAGGSRMVDKVEIDLDHVFHGHEVANLLPGGVAAAAFEESHAPLVTVLVEEVERYRRHSSLVRFARAVDVEIA